MPLYFIALAIISAPQDVLLQYGALGAMTLFLVWAVNRLFQYKVQAHERDRVRADRAEEQLIQLNQLIREQLVAQLTRATDVLGQVTEILSDKRRDRDR